MSAIENIRAALPASLAGRCANGYERDQGVRIHAVPYSAEITGRASGPG